MEVLHGNQAGSKYSRRRSDRNDIADNRLLDWTLHDADIDLLPHSPLALADVLTQKGGFLDLVPLKDDKDEPSTTEPDSVQGSANNRNPAKDKKRSTRERFNLLTNLSETSLLRQCKKILVENALIKNKGERQLYLAAGFIRISNAGSPDTTRRAPLLLYPALLVRIPRQQTYEIRLAGDTPEFNLALLHYLEQAHSCIIPTFREDMPLADFFAHVAESVRETPAVELEFDVALGSAVLTNNVPDEVTVRMPSIPPHFHPALAMSITSNKSLENLSALLRLIPSFNQAEIPDSDPADSDPAEKRPTTSAALSSPSDAASLRRYAAKLAAEGLDHIEFGQLPALPALIAQWSELMLSAASTTTVSTVLNNVDLTARQLIKLSSIIELIDKAPDDLERWGHGDLCYATSAVLLKRAQHQARLIEDELLALQEHFHLDKVPAKSQLLSLMSELGGGIEHEPDFVDADYFNARRQFMEFSTNKPANLTAEHKHLLSQLAKVFRFRELFVNNMEYRSALGSGYKGLRTDWQKLNRVSDFARELASVLGSESIAAAIISNWQNFHGSYVKDLETLKQAAEAARYLLSTVGSRWQSKSTTALAAHAALIAGRLEEWRTQYGSIESHDDKTAAIVLSSFSAPFMDHMLVETQADETQARIRQQLADGELRVEQINDTLAWLAEASAAAEENNLDIEVIVEHLEIA